jgi:hypothetical protein
VRATSRRRRRGEVAAGGYPLVYHADPLHLFTPSPTEWELTQALKRQGASNQQAKRAVREQRRDRKALEQGAGPARQVAEQARIDAQRMEADRRRLVMEQVRSGSRQDAAQNAKIALLGNRLRSLSSKLQSMADKAVDPQQKAALQAQANATAVVAKNPAPAEASSSLTR